MSLSKSQSMVRMLCPQNIASYPSIDDKERPSTPPLRRVCDGATTRLVRRSTYLYRAQLVTTCSSPSCPSVPSSLSLLQLCPIVSKGRRAAAWRLRSRSPVPWKSERGFFLRFQVSSFFVLLDSLFWLNFGGNLELTVRSCHVKKSTFR